MSYIEEHAALARALPGLVDATTQAAVGGELERTIGELLARAAHEGDIRQGAHPGVVMIVLHGVGSSLGRTVWRSKSRMAIDLLIRGLTGE